jgi:hypothetical protein
MSSFLEDDFMDMSEIVRSMSDRMPWPVAQRVLAEAELPRGHGWERTISALSDETADFSEKIEAAAAALVEHQLCGEKLVRIYKVPAKAKAAILSKLERVTIPESKFKKSYPIYLTEDELDTSSGKPTLTAIERTDNGTGVVLSSARVVTTREKLDPTDLKDGLYDEYEEVYGLKEVRHQATDTVWIPTRGNYIDVRIDFPQGMHRDVGEAAQASVKSEFLKLIDDDGLSAPVNLFPQ